MTYRFIYGRAGSGKSRTCYSRICDSLKSSKNKKCMLIVPEQFSFQSEMELLDIGGERAAADVLVCSFKRLSFWVKNKYGIINEKQVNKAGKNLILNDILNTKKHILSVYGGIENGTGFISELSSLFSEFKRYGVTCEQLEDSLSGMDKDSNTYKKVNDLVIIYKEYKKAFENITDPDDALFWLAETISRDGLFKDYEIWIDGFDGFTPCEYEVILQLMENAQRVNITACTDRVSDEMNMTGELFYPIIKNCEKIIALASQRGIISDKAIKCTGTFYKYSNSLEMAHLERNLFSRDLKVYTSIADDISLYIYQNIYEEIVSAADKIICLVREAGYKYKDITVICSDMQNYESYIRSIFSQYQIPFFIDVKKGVDNNPLIVFLNTLLSVYINRYRSEDIFRLLKTGLTGFLPEEIDLLENYVLKFGIYGYMWNDQIEWDFLKEQSDQSSYYNEDDINLIKNAIIGDIRSFFTILSPKSDPKTFFTELYDFLDDYRVLEKYKEIIERFKKSGDLEEANRYLSCYNALIDMMDTAVTVLGNKKYTIEEYSEFIKSGMSGYETGSVPPALEQVNIGNVQRSMVHKVKAVFILGVVEGKFPGVDLNEGLLSDMDRHNLHCYGVELAPDTLSRSFETKYLIYKTLCLPSEKIFISCSSMDMKGVALRPAYVFTLIKKLYKDLIVKGNVAGKIRSFEECTCSPESAFVSLISVLEKRRQGLPTEQRWNSVKKWFEENPGWAARLKPVYKAYNTDFESKKINPDLALELFGSPLTGSVSAFESFTNCPFSFFVKYGLNAMEREKAEITPVGIGSVSHVVLEMFFDKVKRNNLQIQDITDEYIYKTVMDEMNRAVSLVWGKSVLSSKRNSYLLNRYGNTLELTIKTVLKHISKGKFIPIDDEIVFGKKNTLNPLIVKGDTQSAVISGKIDRVDAFNLNGCAYIRIIDYKTGKKAFSQEDFYYGLQIQLPVYMNAILSNQQYFKNIFKLDKITPAGILYYNIDDPIVKAEYSADSEQIKSLVDNCLMMKGLVLDKEEIVLAMDTGFIDKSDIVNIKRNKDGSFSKTSDIVSIDDFDIMLKYTNRILGDIINRIGTGSVDRMPVYKGTYTGCDYCSYKGSCGFDPSLKWCRYNFLRSGLKRDEIKILMEQKINREK